MIAHLSDLHFGRINPAIAPALSLAIAAARPDLVVVSGDLTQRARRGEFRAARRFLETLPQPQLVVPGNHDMPLYNVMARWLNPLSRYRRFISDDLQPYFEDAEIAVLGINTARANTFKNGRVNAGQIVHACGRFEASATGKTRIIVTHHPFDLPQSGDAALLVGGARLAMAGFAESRVDLILSGHLHGNHAAESSARYGGSSRPVLLVQAGTATSTRLRGEENSFNLLHLDAASIRVDCMAWDEAGGCFALAETGRFVRTGPNLSRQQESAPSP